jgi:hypothetical protein
MNLFDQIKVSSQFRRPNETQSGVLRQQLLEGKFEGLITGIFRSIIPKDVKA